MAVKRIPLLADRFMAAKPEKLILPMRTINQLRADLAGAERFVFDKQAAHRCGTVIREVPDLIAREIQFARPPFDSMWLEFPARDYWAGLGEPPINELGGTPQTDHTLGFLIVNNRVNVFFGSDPAGPRLRGRDTSAVPHEHRVGSGFLPRVPSPFRRYLSPSNKRTKRRRGLARRRG